jgi:GT2 family glycosyltransferase
MVARPSMTAPRIPALTPRERPLLASVVITTYNRAEVLPSTAAALAGQDTPRDRYEIVIVDNGSADETPRVLDELAVAHTLVRLRLEPNRGYSGGINAGLQLARGQYLILVSDDLIVPADFVRRHVETLRAHPGFWAVGGIRQLPAVTETPFGRWVDGLERGFEAARKQQMLEPDLWELSWPTARNLAIPAGDLERIGLFDEQFSFGCEDQDLAHRARQIGVRFLYDTKIACLHNDAAATLPRYSRSQEQGARNTVFFCTKYPAEHGEAAIARVNGPWRWSDGPRLWLAKTVKSILARGPGLAAIEALIAAAERLRVPERVLHRLYRARIGLAIFRGWRSGLAAREAQARETRPAGAERTRS